MSPSSFGARVASTTVAASRFFFLIATAAAAAAAACFVVPVVAAVEYCPEDRDQPSPHHPEQARPSLAGLGERAVQLGLRGRLNDYKIKKREHKTEQTFPSEGAKTKR